MDSARPTLADEHNFLWESDLDGDLDLEALAEEYEFDFDLQLELDALSDFGLPDGISGHRLDSDGNDSTPRPMPSGDGPYLESLANGNFSSPSSYAPFIPAPIPGRQQQHTTGGHRSRWAPNNSPVAMGRRRHYHMHQTPPPPPQPVTNATTTASAPRRSHITLNSRQTPRRSNPASQAASPSSASSSSFSSSPSPSSSSTLPPSPLTAAENTHLDSDVLSLQQRGSLFDRQRSTPSNTMPTLRRRPAAVARPPATALETPNKRRRVSGTQPRSSSRSTVHESPREPKRHLDGDEEELFVRDHDFGTSPPPELADDFEGIPTVDLTQGNEVPEELKKPLVDKRVKLSAFQCVVCMDDVTSLTVTHCGHLYCAECLHTSLHVEATKGKCPMCRAKVDMRNRASYTSKTKGFWPLELKLMTKSRKGKRKAGSSS